MGSDSENYKSLKAFFSEEYHSLRSYAQSRINDTADRDAEDIVQDVALKLFSRADSASPIENVAGFVYHAIRNRIIDLIRTKKNRSSIEDQVEMRLAEFAELFYGTTDNAYSEEMVTELKRAIGDLKPVYRNIITAIDFEGYTYKELAMETEIPEGTLMSRRHRALALLYTELKQKKETTN